MTEVVLHTHALKRRFGELTAVRNLSITVPAQSVYGFLGPNGAGKTTTIRLILGLLRPDAGSVSLFGHPVRGAARIRALSRLGALVETPSFYAHLSGRENLRVLARLTGARPAAADHVLSVVKLTDAAQRPVRDYSLGMRQRLGLAMALLGEPSLLILDEPTNGLDPAGISEMREMIRAMPDQHGITVFLSSHLLGEVERIATHVGIIDRGQLLFEGPLEELGRHSAARLEIGVNDPAHGLQILQAEGRKAESVDGMLVLGVIDRQEAARLNAALISAGLAVSHLYLRKPSLEELFLSFTGSGSRSEAV